MAPQVRQRQASEVPGVFLGRGVETFVVVRDGVFEGVAMSAGDVLVCRGEAKHGDPTVLVALGLGRPRLGSRRGTRWLGDGGEPCAEERWRSAGRLVARCRRTREGWVADLLDGRPQASAEPRPSSASGLGVGAPLPLAGPASEAVPPPAAQLSLFAA